MKRIAATVVLCAVFGGCVYLLFNATQNQALLAIPMVLCVLGAIKLYRKKPGKAVQPPQRAAQAPQPAAQPTPSTTYTIRITPPPERAPHQMGMDGRRQVKIKLAGTASVAGRQTLLGKIYNMEEPYDDVTYDIEEYEYRGKPAFQFFVNPQGDEERRKVLGSVPADRVEEVKAFYDRITDVDIDVYGGPEFVGDDKYYGARATLYVES